MRIDLIKGCEGYCLCFNDYRICGNKPWGGGNVVTSWELNDFSLKRLAELLNDALGRKEDETN